MTPVAPAPSAAPADGAEIVRIGDAIEADEERARLGRQLEGVRVPVRLAAGEDALMIASPGLLGQLPFGPGLRPGPGRWLLEPWLGR